MNKYAWFFDVFILAIILFYLYTGGKRGFVKSILIFVGYIVAFGAAFFVSNNFSDNIYDTFVKDKVVSSVETQISKVNITDEVKRALNNSFGKYGVTLTDQDVEDILKDDSVDFTDKITQKINSTYRDANVDSSQIQQIVDDLFNSSVISDIIPSLSGFMPKTLQELFNTQNMTVDETLHALSGDVHTTAEYIETNVLRPNILGIIKTILFVITFFIVKTICYYITRMMSFVNKIPLVGPVNTLLGLALGLLEGLLVAYIVAMIVRFVVFISSGNMIVFNDDTINSTLIFKHIYDINILSL